MMFSRKSSPAPRANDPERAQRRAELQRKTAEFFTELNQPASPYRAASVSESVYNAENPYLGRRYCDMASTVGRALSSRHRHSLSSRRTPA